MKFINDRVRLVNRIAFDAWNFASMFVMHCLENDVFDIPEMNVVFFEFMSHVVNEIALLQQKII